MPMLQARRKPDHITGANFLDRSAFALNPAEARGDNQCLAEGMRVPGGTGARLERHAAAADTRRIGRLEQRVDADRAGEIFYRSLARRLRTRSYELHCSIPSLWRSSRWLCDGSSDGCHRSEAAGGGENASACDHVISSCAVSC